MDFDQPIDDFIVKSSCPVSKNNPDGEKYNPKHTTTRLCRKYYEEYDFFTLKFKKIQIMYAWNGVYYETNLRRAIMSSVGDLYYANNLEYENKIGNEVFNRLVNKKEIELLDLNHMKGKIPFLNGYFDIKTNMLLNPDRTYKCTYCIPHKYNPKAVSKIFKPALEQILPNKRDRERLLIYLAYCLTSEVKYHKSLILYGRGGNGKSIVGFTMTYILGPKLHTEIPLHLLGERFNQILYLMQLFNYDDDAESKALQSNSFHKKVTSGPTLSGEYKGGGTIKYKNMLHCLTACNIVPDVPDDTTDGFWRKVEIIPFTQTFSDEIGNCDEDLLENIENNEEELEGIITYIMGYLPRLKELLVHNVEKTMDQWMKYGDSAKVFFHSFLAEPANKGVYPNLLYKWFKKWSDANKFVKLTNNIFGKRMAKMGVVKAQRTSKRDLNPLTGERVGEAHKYYVYENCYPNFPPEVEKLLGIVKDDQGYYVELTEEEKIVQAIIDTPIDLTEPNYGVDMDVMLTGTTSNKRNKLNLILEKAREIQGDDPSEPFTWEDIYEPLATVDGISEQFIRNSLVEWHKDGTLYCPSNDHYKLSKIQKGKDWIDNYPSKTPLRKPLKDVTAKYTK